MCYVSILRCKLRHLFHNWQGERCISITISYMVRVFFPFRKFLTTNCNSFVNFGRLPFDWRNPLLYTILFCTLYIEFILATHFIACVASIFAGLCVMLITFAKDLKQDLCSFQLEDGAENSSEFQVKLCQFVEFHSNVKQLSHNERWQRTKFGRKKYIFVQMWKESDLSVLEWKKKRKNWKIIFSPFQQKLLKHRNSFHSDDIILTLSVVPQPSYRLIRSGNKCFILSTDL